MCSNVNKIYLSTDVSKIACRKGNNIDPDHKEEESD